MKELLELDPATTDRAPPTGMVQHIADRDDDGAPKERTLCGLAWDVVDRPVTGPLCKACRQVMVDRGHGHLIPHVGKPSGGPMPGGGA